MSYSSSSSTGHSSSLPEVVQSPQSEYSLNMAQIAEELGNQTYNWAQGVYGNTANLSDQEIENFNGIGAQAQSNANNIQSQYENEFEPENADLVNLAGQYSSGARIAANEGAAESGAEQAGAAGLANTKANLQSYGIDPSSGMYGELEQATNAQTGAAAAGQAQQARLNTEATGRQLLGEAVGVGEQMPGQVANDQNIANQAYGGAENANLGTAQVGATLADAASPYLSDAASALKLPPTGSLSNSTQGSSSYSSKPGSGGSGGGGEASTQGSSGGSGVAGGGTYQNVPGTGGGYGGGTSSAASDTYPGGFGGGDESSTGGSGGGNYAAGGDVSDHAMGGASPSGGVIPDSTSGGHVPLAASPSRGTQTDDIPARLNAEEFVVPRDVARWKGEEFFQKLINQSRMARHTASAHATAGPPVGNAPPRFQSHNLGGAI
jgi:hypothetical protein